MSVQAGRWWDCHFDVQTLASTAVGATCHAARQLVAERGQSWTVETSPSLIVGAFSALENLTIANRRAAGWAPLSGFFRTEDGWVRLHGNYPHHAKAIARALGCDDDDALRLRILSLDAATVEDAVVGAGGIAAKVLSPEQWLLHPQALATRHDTWSTVTSTSARRALVGGHMPLDGVRVLDLTRVVAGPTCSQLLACLGAEVLRIDPPRRPELPDQYLSNGMGKRSALADLGALRRELEALLTMADVVLLGYRPGSLARFGLDPDDLVSRYPELIVASLSAWGEHGPWGNRAGFDSIVQAATGIAIGCSDALLGGSETNKPGALPVQALDHSTGAVLAAGVIELLARGQAGTVHASLLGAARYLQRLPLPARGQAVGVPDSRVKVRSPCGILHVAPPPLMLDGQTLEREVRLYGGDSLTWESSP